MAFTKKTWIARDVQYPGRRILTPTGNTNEYDVTRSEGIVNADGDIVSKENLDDLENRIFTGLASGTNGDADNALKLGGVAASTIIDGTGNAQNALKLGGEAANNFPRINTWETNIPTLLNGWTTSESPVFIRWGRFIFVQFGDTVTGGTPGSLLATLPSDFAAGIGWGRDNCGSALLILEGNNIYVAQGTSVPPGSCIFACASYTL